MARPKVLNYTPAALQWRNYSRDLRQTEWGSGIKLNVNNREPLIVADVAAWAPFVSPSRGLKSKPEKSASRAAIDGSFVPNSSAREMSQPSHQSMAGISQHWA
jgi:hypothetical protein